jgi:hypothetical protein
MAYATPVMSSRAAMYSLPCHSGRTGMSSATVSWISSRGLLALRRSASRRDSGISLFWILVFE